MIGVILAAGMAKRLRPLTDTQPKCLLKVGERTLLERTVDAQLAAGINELVVVTGYRGEMIRGFLTEHYPTLTIHFIHNADYEHNNNIFSLWMTRPYTDGKDFLLMDSDILLDPKLVKAIVDETGTALALNRHECGEEEIKIITDSEGRVVELSKTCSIADHEDGEDFVIAVMQMHHQTGKNISICPSVVLGKYSQFWDVLYAKLKEFFTYFCDAVYMCEVKFDSSCGGPILMLDDGSGLKEVIMVSIPDRFSEVTP